MSDTKTTPERIFNKVVDPEAVAIMAMFYRFDPLAMAKLCDDHLDRRGALLGDVRTAARNSA